MEFLSINHIIVYSFLLLTLFIGILASKNINTIKDYAIANRSYSNHILIMTFIATFIGGNNIQALPCIAFNDGIIFIVLTIITIVISFLIIGFFIAPSILYFNESLTMGNIVGLIYGHKARIISSIIGFLFCLMIVGSQILVIGRILSSFL
ncbi:MAG: hypothetical protein GY830_07180 [Bacteroidetes bacterium]|nr:hypothetical protein [Bacteroidota bacterium]